jgi:hypothetical protein
MSSRDRVRRAPAARKAARVGLESLEERQLLNGDPVAVVPAITTALGSTSDTDADAAAADSATIATETDSPGGIETTSTPIPTATPTTQPGALPDLVPLSFATPGNLDWDQDFRATGTIVNQGDAATTSPFQVDLFAAPELVSTTGAVAVGSFNVPAGLAAGASYNFDVTLHTPGRPTNALSNRPSYYMRLSVDTTNTVAESNETNNLSRGLQGVDTAVVTVTPRLPSKLVPAGISVSSGVLDWGGTIRVTATVRNEGAGDAPATNARIVLAPYGEDPFGPRGYTIGTVPIPRIGAYQTVSATQEIRLPQFPPTQLSNVGKFVVKMVSDADATADPVVKPINYQSAGLDWTTALITPKPAPVTTISLPDLALDAITTPNTAAWDQTIQMKARIENVGKSDAGAFKVRFLLVQSDDPSAPALVLGDVPVDGLAVGVSREVTQTFKLPAQVPAALNAQSTAGRIIARIDPDRVLDESKLENNRLVSLPITLRLVGDGTVATPVTTTTTTTPTTTTPTKQTNTTPKPTSPTAARAVAIAGRIQAQQAQRLARQRLAHERAVAREARAKQLRIYPRVRQTPIRRTQSIVRILPIQTSNDGASATDQSA